MAEEHVVFYEQDIERHPEWRNWYMLNEDNAPGVISYKTVPVSKIDFIQSHDECIYVATENIKDDFICYGRMMFESKFIKEFSLLDRETERKQASIKLMYEREQEMHIKLKEISERFKANLRSALESGHGFSTTKYMIDSLFRAIREELCCLLPILPYFDDKDGLYHPICNIEISKLQPDVVIKPSEEEGFSLIIDNDSKKLLNLIRLDLFDLDWYLDYPELSKKSLTFYLSEECKDLKLKTNKKI